jgi:hypothetical protein
LVGKFWSNPAYRGTETGEGRVVNATGAREVESGAAVAARQGTAAWSSQGRTL